MPRSSESQSWRASVPLHSAKALLWWLLAPLLLTARDSPFLLLAMGALGFAVWGGVSGFGVPLLFWHEDPWTQLAAGVATALVVWELCFIAYLLASRDHEWTERNPMQGWLLRTGAPLCVILGLAPLGPHEPDSWLEFEVGLVLGTITVVGLRRVVAWTLQPGRLLARLVDRLCSAWLSLPAFEHRLQAVYFGLMLLFYLSWTAAAWVAALWWSLDPWVPAAVALVLALGLVSAVYGAIRFNLDRNRVFVYVGAIVLLALLQHLTFGSRHRFPGLDYDEPVSLSAGAGVSAAQAGLLDQTAVLEAWRARLAHPGRQAPKLVVIAVSGGGLRSATWSAGVLVELERRLPEFPDHVRLLTGASGGMVAASHWVATLEAPGLSGPKAGRHGGHDVVKEISRNALETVAVHLALPLPGDRGLALERALERNSEGALRVGLRALGPGEAAGWRPSLLLSPVIVEDGREMLFSNVNLAALTVSDPWLDPGVDCSDAAARGREPCSHSVAGLEFFRLFPGADPRLSTIVRLNASFPYVSPPVQVATTPSRRLVDAGYADPYGVDLATRWIAHHRSWLREHTSGVVLIQIRDEHRQGLSADPSRPWFQRSLAGVFAPGEAVIESRRTSVVFRNDKLVALLAALFADGAHGELPFFTTVAFELDAEASLSWALTERERRGIGAAIHSAHNEQAFAWLEQWWLR